MFLRKTAAGSAPGHTWSEDGEVREVSDELALELLRIPDGGFTEAAAPEAEAVPEDDPELLPSPEEAEMTSGQKAAATRAANKAAAEAAKTEEATE